MERTLLERKLLDTPKTLISEEQAKKIVATLTDSDPDWFYKAIPAAPDSKESNFYCVEVRDENHDLMGYI